MMNPLLDNMFMFRIIRIEDLHRLPPAPPLIRIAHLQRRRRDQHRERKTLRVDPRLDQLLRTTQVRIPAHERERDGDTGDPGCRDDGVAVGAAPFLEALRWGLGGFETVERELRLVPVLARGVAVPFEGARGAVGADYGGEGGGGGCEEGFHGER